MGPKLVDNMDERRKAKRSELLSKIILKRLDGGITDEVKIDVVDLSKFGVGFTCDTPLTIGAIYEAYLTIWTKEVLHAVLEVVRIEKLENTISYGATFVGMPEMDAFRIETYQTIEEER
ncbi:MAG TPA: PilZ domain-containing protein [Lachnospiraceae bacterium]|nr:PilZ domain-containing protein [Lachnospiraceae bacterium]